MTRMGSDGYSSQGSTQISAKVDSALKERFKESCDDRNLTMTEALDQKIREFVEESGYAKDDPIRSVVDDDDLLTDAYSALLRESGPLDRLETDEVETIVAEETKIQKKHVRKAILDPLAEKGAIRPAWGTVIIYEPDEVRGENA